MSANPKVSVKIVTYNHEPFIAQTIEGVLMQRTNFTYEMVIGEDCSTDRTREIVKAYAEQHPDKIRLILQQQNKGPRPNCRETMASCRGDYIAILDGDDFWTSADKLQKQADFLDGHPECATCFHNTNLIYDDGREPRLYHRDALKPILTMADLLTKNWMPASSIMYRNHLFNSIPKEFDAIPFGDWPLQILCAQKGTACYFPEVMGTYRIHKGGMWSATGESRLDNEIRWCQWVIKFYRVMDGYLRHEYHELIQERIADHRKMLREARTQRYKEWLKKRFPPGYQIYRSLKCGLR